MPWAGGDRFSVLGDGLNRVEHETKETTGGGHGVARGWTEDTHTREGSTLFNVDQRSVFSEVPHASCIEWVKAEAEGW